MKNSRLFLKKYVGRPILKKKRKKRAPSVNLFRMHTCLKVYVTLSLASCPTILKVSLSFHQTVVKCFFFCSLSDSGEKWSFTLLKRPSIELITSHTQQMVMALKQMALVRVYKCDPRWNVLKRELTLLKTGLSVKNYITHKQSGAVLTYVMF